MTVADRIASIWPGDWFKATYADFSTEARQREPHASTDEIAEMWEDKFELSWYAQWKLDKALKDEQDLWVRMSKAWQSAANGPWAVDTASIELDEFAHGFTNILIDEAQFLTPLLVKLLALSCGRPNRVVVGMDCKQSIGKH